MLIYVNICRHLSLSCAVLQAIMLKCVNACHHMLIKRHRDLETWKIGNETDVFFQISRSTCKYKWWWMITNDDKWCKYKVSSMEKRNAKRKQTLTYSNIY